LDNKHSNQDFLLFKAECLVQLKENTKALSCINEYVSLKPDSQRALYMLANTFYNLQKWEDAAKSWESYLKIAPNDSKARFKLGECYYKLKDYPKAENNYQQATLNIDQKSSKQSLATSYYWLALMQIKNNKSKQATKSFNDAVNLDQKLNSEDLGVGVLHEHFGKWEYALDAYKNQLQQDGNNAELNFKIASLLESKFFKPDQALEYFEEALKLDKVRPEWHFSLANCYEEMGDYYNAVIWYKSAIDRKQRHTPEWYRRLGFALEKSGEPNKALEAFQEANLFRRPSSIDNKFYKKHIKSSSTRYAISYNHYQVNDKMVFYESMAGSRLMCNPLAIFQHLMANEEFKHYTHVWTVKNIDNVPEELRSLSNVLFVKRDTDLYMRYSTSAKYIITNSKLSRFITRKPEQKLLDTWHGTAYKTIGGHDSASPLGYKNANKNFLSTTNVLTPNPHMSTIQPDCYQFKHIYSGQMAETGYPRIDSTINITSVEKKQLATELNINMDKPILLYAPTWRGTYSINVYDVTKFQDDLMILSILYVQLIFRGHHLMEKHIKGKLNNIKVVPANIDSNRLLGIVDLLITDYSSIFYDYLVTDKPIIHYLYDLETYSKSRGLYFGVDELPGDVAFNIDEVLRFINQYLKTEHKPSMQYKLNKQQFCPHEDGNVSKRVVDWFFHGNTEDVKLVNIGNKPSILVYGGDFTPGSKTDKFIDKIKNMDLDTYNVNVIIPPNVAKSTEKTQQFKLLPEQTMIFPYMEGMIMTLQERQAIEYYNQHNTFVSKDMEDAYHKAFSREVRRALGESRFIEVID